MVGQLYGATGESPKDDRQDAGPTASLPRTPIQRCPSPPNPLFFAIILKNAYCGPLVICQNPVGLAEAAHEPLNS
jgi:hypothetical protein